MELQSNVDMGDDDKMNETFTKLGLNLETGFIKDVVSNLPGIDEAVAFGELKNNWQYWKLYSCVWYSSNWSHSAIPEVPEHTWEITG